MMRFEWKPETPEQKIKNELKAEARDRKVTNIIRTLAAGIGLGGAALAAPEFVSKIMPEKSAIHGPQTPGPGTKEAQPKADSAAEKTEAKNIDIVHPEE